MPKKCCKLNLIKQKLDGFLVAKPPLFTHKDYVKLMLLRNLMRLI